MTPACHCSLQPQDLQPPLHTPLRPLFLYTHVNRAVGRKVSGGQVWLQLVLVCWEELKNSQNYGNQFPRQVLNTVASFQLLVHPFTSYLQGKWDWTPLVAESPKNLNSLSHPVYISLLSSFYRQITPCIVVSQTSFFFKDYEITKDAKGNLTL